MTIRNKTRSHQGQFCSKRDLQTPQSPPPSGKLTGVDVAIGAGVAVAGAVVDVAIGAGVAVAGAVVDVGIGVDVAPALPADSIDVGAVVGEASNAAVGAESGVSVGVDADAGVGVAAVVTVAALVAVVVGDTDGVCPPGLGVTAASVAVAGGLV
jgi:hypothetical protein